MAQVLVRELENEVVERLRRRAAHNGRSLEAELRLILGRAAATDMDEARAAAARLRERLAGRTHSDSTTLLAEDRGR